MTHHIIGIVLFCASGWMLLALVNFVLIPVDKNSMKGAVGLATLVIAFGVGIYLMVV